MLIGSQAHDMGLYAPPKDHEPSPLLPEKKVFKMTLPYTGMAAIFVM